MAPHSTHLLIQGADSDQRVIRVPSIHCTQLSTHSTLAQPWGSHKLLQSRVVAPHSTGLLVQGADSDQQMIGVRGGGAYNSLLPAVNTQQAGSTMRWCSLQKLVQSSVVAPRSTCLLMQGAHPTHDWGRGGGRGDGGGGGGYNSLYPAVNKLDQL